MSPSNSRNKQEAIRHEADKVFPVEDLDREESLRLTPLTGRDTEVSLLANRWELANEGMGQVVLLIGEAGLGKSRMVGTLKDIVLSEAVEDAAGSVTQPRVIEWRCFNRSQDSELFPVTDYFQRHFGFRADESSTERFDRLAQYLDECGLGQPQLVALFAKLLFLPADERYPEPGLTPMREREETFRAMREWLHACSRRQPVLFVVEDLHWIDASSLELLKQFIAEGLHDHILTVLTFRPEFRTPWPAVAHQTSLALNRLTHRQVSELMRKSAGATLPASLVAQIYERTGGVPLLVEEFIRMARESAIFEAGSVEGIPVTLKQLVMARLDRLASNREIAQFAATLGREFQYEMLAAVVNVDEPTLQAELTKLAEAEILFRKGSPPRCAYLFKHALLEEALHNALETAERRQFHRKVGEVMEARFPELADNQPELLALHFTEAGLMEKALGYWLRAGQRSIARFANVEAISHLRRGLEMLQTLDESAARDARELELLGPLGTAYIATRGYAAPEVGPIFDRARSLAGRSGEPTPTFAMMRGHFAYHIVRGDFPLCTDLAAQAVRFARQVDDAGILMEALFLEGITQFYRGDFASAHDCFAAALSDYDDRERTAFWATLTGENCGVTVRCYLALACWHLGAIDRARAVNLEARELARSIRHPFSLGYALHHTGWLHQHMRLGAEAQVAGDEETRVATEQGFPLWQATGSLYAGAGLLLQGRTEQGLAAFQEGLDAYRATGAILGLPYYLSILGEAFTSLGRFDDAHRVFDEAFALVEKNDERFQEAELHRLRGELHLAEMHDEVAAEASFRRALEIARRQQSRAWELRAAVSLARLFRQQGRRHQALTLLRPAFDVFTEGLQTPDLLDAAALLEELGHDRMRDEIEAGIKYVRGCIPPPILAAGGPVAVDWRYIPSSTLGGDTIGYHWVDQDHLALYLIDVTGHGLDSALLAVAIVNVIRSGFIADADPRQPDRVLKALNEGFQGSQHNSRYFTLWYGVYNAATRELTYASGGHPSSVVVSPHQAAPILCPATGPLMGISPEMTFPASTLTIPECARIFIFSDGVFEIRRGHLSVWNLSDCIMMVQALAQQGAPVMDRVLTHVCELRGSSHLDDDFSFIEATFN